MDFGESKRDDSRCIHTAAIYCDTLTPHISLERRRPSYSLVVFLKYQFYFGASIGRSFNSVDKINYDFCTAVAL